MDQQEIIYQLPEGSLYSLVLQIDESVDVLERSSNLTESSQGRVLRESLTNHRWRFGWRERVARDLNMSKAEMTPLRKAAMDVLSNRLYVEWDSKIQNHLDIVWTLHLCTPVNKKRLTLNQ